MAHVEKNAMTESSRIFLSPPHMSARHVNSCSRRSTPIGSRRWDRMWTRSRESLRPDRRRLRRGAFERHGGAARCSAAHGTRAGDEVITSSLTFAATANAITYLGGMPVFVDSDHDQRGTWTRPLLVGRVGQRALRRGKLPKAVVVVDIYGQCADYDRDREHLPQVWGSAHRRRGGGARCVVSREGRRAVWRVRLLLVQWQQDHHDQRRRHARVSQRGAGTPGPLSCQPGVWAGAAL